MLVALAASSTAAFQQPSKRSASSHQRPDFTYVGGKEFTPTALSATAAPRRRSGSGGRGAQRSSGRDGGGRGGRSGRGVGRDRGGGASRGQQQQRVRGGGRGGRSTQHSADDEYDDPFGDYDDHGTGGGGDDADFGRDESDFDDEDDVIPGASPPHRSPSTAGEWGEADTDGEVPRSHFFSKKPLADPQFSSSSLSFDEEDGIFDRLCDAAGIAQPSRIQALAWPTLLRGEPALVADQTGSGKTLAYLIPLLRRMLAYKRSHPEEKRAHGSPKVLILAPTSELADQIREVCNRLSISAPFKTMVTTATGKHATSVRDQIRHLQRNPVDVLISTPGRIGTILRTRNSGLDLTGLQSIVLDEVDILLIDDTFGPQLRTVGAAAPVDSTQFVFVTATLPDSVVQTVKAEFPGVREVRGPGLHRVAPTVREHLVDVSVPPASNRDRALDLGFDLKAEQLLKALGRNRCKRTLVFCNTVDSCRDVENLLRRKDRRGRTTVVGAYHNAMAPEARNRNLEVFAHGRKTADDDGGRGGGGGGKRNGKQRGDRRMNAGVDDENNDDGVDHVLVCTDRAARGVDFDASPVDHVVLFDFPRDPAEYVRRVGRTARAGRDGASTVLAYGWQLPVARKVMGKKLDKFTVAAEDFGNNNDHDGGDEDSYEYRGAAARRKGESQKGGGRGRGQGGGGDLRGNIAGGKLWK